MPCMIDDIVNKFSKLIKVKHVMAWVMLFIQKCRKQANDSKLSPKLIETATVKLLLNNQRDINLADYQKFAPFKDNGGIVRVGGRLTFSNLPYPQPIMIMPGNLCDLLVDDAHSRLNHMGVEYTLSSLRSQGFWIRRKLVKSVLNRCRICRRLYARPMKQQMKWSWAGHINRLKDERWTSRVTNWRPYDKKIRQGRRVALGGP